MSFCILISQNSAICTCNHAANSFSTSSSSWNFWPARCFFKSKDKWTLVGVRFGLSRMVYNFPVETLQQLCIFNFCTFLVLFGFPQQLLSPLQKYYIHIHTPTHSSGLHGNYTKGHRALILQRNIHTYNSGFHTNYKQHYKRVIYTHIPHVSTVTA